VIGQLQRRRATDGVSSVVSILSVVVLPGAVWSERADDLAIGNTSSPDTLHCIDGPGFVLKERASCRDSIARLDFVIVAFPSQI
jgi:hypothetical protein